MVRVQHSLTRLFEAVPHMEGVMFNTNRTHLMLHRAWVETSSKPSKILVKRWGFILFAGLNYLFTLPMPVWPAQGGAVAPPAPTQLCRAKRKNTFWQLLLQLWSVTFCFVLQAPWAPKPCTSPQASFPGKVYSVSHSHPRRVYSVRGTKQQLLLTSYSNLPDVNLRWHEKLMENFGHHLLGRSKVAWKPSQEKPFFSCNHLCTP